MPSPTRTLCVVLVGLSACVADDVSDSRESITTEAPICDGFLTGDLWLNDRYDVEALAGVRVITGTLHIVDTDLERIALPCIEAMGGLRIEYNEAAEKVELPALETVADRIWISGNSIEQIRAPRLRWVGNDLVLTRLPALDKLGLPRLEGVGRDLAVTVTGLRTWDGLDELREARNVFVSYNSRLKDVGLPALGSLAVLFVFENPALEILGFEGLSGPAYTVWIHNNRVLPTCEAEELVGRVDAQNVLVFRNDDAGSCD